MDFFKNMLSSPNKAAATPATPSASGDASDAGPSSPSPANGSRRIHKSRKSGTPSSVVNAKSNASRRQSAPAKRAAMTPLPKANVKRSRHSTALQTRNRSLQEEDEEAEDSETVYASQPISITATSEPTSASKPSAKKTRAKRGSLLRSSKEQAKAADAEVEADASQSSKEVTTDLANDDGDAQVSDDADKAEGADADNNNDVIDEETFTFTSLLAHRWSGDEIEIKVNWHGSEPTWEPEFSLHQDAPDALFAYWRTQGGRPENPRDAGLFDIFAIRKHSRNKMRLLVEWTGYPSEDSTWESKKTVEEAAPELLAEYWESVKPASKRGSKKN